MRFVSKMRSLLSVWIVIGGTCPQGLRKGATKFGELHDEMIVMRVREHPLAPEMLSALSTEKNFGGSLSPVFPSTMPGGSA